MRLLVGAALGLAVFSAVAGARDEDAGPLFIPIPSGKIALAEKHFSASVPAGYTLCGPKRGYTYLNTWVIPLDVTKACEQPKTGGWERLIFYINSDYSGDVGYPEFKEHCALPGRPDDVVEFIEAGKQVEGLPTRLCIRARANGSLAKYVIVRRAGPDRHFTLYHFEVFAYAGRREAADKLMDDLLARIKISPE